MMYYATQGRTQKSIPFVYTLYVHWKMGLIKMLHWGHDVWVQSSVRYVHLVDEFSVGKVTFVSCQ